MTPSERLDEVIGWLQQARSIDSPKELRASRLRIMDAINGLTNLWRDLYQLEQDLVRETIRSRSGEKP